MVRGPNTGPEIKERGRAVEKLRRDLARFQRIPTARREAECADEGEQLCRALLSELESQGPSVDHV
jgi:hypothetical protein